MKTRISLIVGNGEIGSALKEVLEKKYTVVIKDKEPLELDESIQVGVMHIAIPYTRNFEKIVHNYQIQYKPKYTVIHSTVPMGTCKRLGAYDSPVRGVHPHLAKSLKTFVKYLAPQSQYLKKYFETAGIKIKLVKDSKTTEALKLWCTTLYGINIIVEKEMYAFCKKYGVDFNIVYTDTNTTYNQGYKELGFPQYQKYILKHMNGGCGGHCVINNCNILKPISASARFILEQNKKYGLQPGK